MVLKQQSHNTQLELDDMQYPSQADPLDQQVDKLGADALQP